MKQTKHKRGLSRIAAPVLLGLALALAGCDSPAGSSSTDTVPAAPAAPTITPASGQLAASWPAVSGATAYEVWYGTEENSANATKSGDDVTGTEAVITGLSDSTTYYVWIKAKNGAGTSGFSPPASGTTAPAVNGSADIALTPPPEFGLQDAWLIAGGTGAVTLSKSGANSVPTSKEFSVDSSAAPAGASYSWRFDGQEIGTEASVTVNAETGIWECGGHSLSLEISVQNRTWSNRIRVSIVD